VAYSRYEGLLSDPPMEARRFIPDKLLKTTPDRWRRCLLPVRLTERLPRPSIHLVVPLTRKYVPDEDNVARPDLSAANTAGLLIVLRDRWYAQAGLAETLELEIGVHEHWTKPGKPEGGPEQDWTVDTYHAAGYDPIVSTGHLEGGKSSIREVFEDGPVGHTFDIGATSSYLAASSFVLPKLPGEISATVASHAWVMAQIRLRRTIREGDDASTTRTTRESPWASEWTAPEWVQFLPDANALIPEAWRADGKGPPPAIKRHATDGEKLSVSGWEDPAFGIGVNGRHFDHWLLVTRPIVDVRGQPREEYVAILGRKKGDTGTRFSVIDGRIPEDALLFANAHVRVMELRIASGHQADPQAKFREKITDSGKHPLDYLFGYKKDPTAQVFEDALAQVSAVSDRLDISISPAIS
jgi:hypothetical protein